MRNQMLRASQVIAILLLTVVFGFLIIFFALPRKDAEGAQRVLEDQGYTRVEITGWRFWGCSKGDQFHTGFKALSPAKRPVSGVVCDGWFKGATVRFD